ncbi:ASCH domain-containing protein [Breoghania sp.]|uniref:ASCH domain-containing protein n=1 Tax=Breoghania sp. TaxID=2065378 RepID=UPI0029C9DD09|nr:ASCH domain-containing protein [Breoghania sp.]
MVAYNFVAVLAPQIEARTKTQTVRANRRRHARPGEPVQLYTGMRTRSCRKLIAPDPICRCVRPITIDVTDLIAAGIAAIAIGGDFLTFDEIEQFARADGFAPEFWGGTDARENMGAFWRRFHGNGRFEGVLIEWGTE